MSDFSMVDLFRTEVDNQMATFTTALLELEKKGSSASNLEALMRASHSIKGAARLVRIGPVERLAHVMEDCFCAAQTGAIEIHANAVDLLLAACDLLQQIASQPEGQFDAFVAGNPALFEDTVQKLTALSKGQAPAPTGPRPDAPRAAPEAPKPTKWTEPEPADAPSLPRDRSLRMAADRLDALVGLAGEVQVSTGRLTGLSNSMIQLKRQIFDLLELLSEVRENLGERSLDRTSDVLRQAEGMTARCSELVTSRLEEIESYDRRMYALSSRLHQAVVATRMCHFSEGVSAFPRLVRDLGRELGKNVELVIEGAATTVDRDVLERMEAPLNHLLRNAVDHGVEGPEERLAAGKKANATVVLRASHRAGMLAVEVEDDGRGIDLEGLRRSVVKKGLTSEEMATRLTRDELLEFLYLPRFSTKDEVGTISGRGVGLDVVRNNVVDLGGRLFLDFVPGNGCHFLLMLPLALSVSRNLLVDIAGEVYAFPLNRIDAVVAVTRDQVTELQGRPLFRYRDTQVPLVTAHQLLDLPQGPSFTDQEISVILLNKASRRYGLVVDRFLGEEDLVIQTLDARYGKLKNIAAGSILEDGSPVLVIDVEDLYLSIDRICEMGTVDNVRRMQNRQAPGRPKRVLVVDDSITVREVERKILEVQGYDVDVAVDGMDGWHAVRTGTYDLVISDVDMPRMDGIKLVSCIRADPRLKNLPVMIVSYKDRPEDRAGGLEAGADHYLTKSSFDDDSFLKAVHDLIGRGAVV